MKSFKFKFEKLYVVLSYVAMALCVAIAAFNIYRCITGGGFVDFYSSLQYIIIFAVCAFTPVLLISVIYHSSYEIENGKFTTKFGFIKSTFQIREMTQLVYNKSKKKLAIYTGEQFMVFKINEEWLDEFIGELKANNKFLTYNETEDEKKEKKDEDKK